MTDDDISRRPLGATYQECKSLAARLDCAISCTLAPGPSPWTRTVRGPESLYGDVLQQQRDQTDVENGEHRRFREDPCAGRARRCHSWDDVMRCLRTYEFDLKLAAIGLHAEDGAALAAVESEEYQSLFIAWLAHPYQRDRALVLADWLEEHRPDLTHLIQVVRCCGWYDSVSRNFRKP